MIVKINEYSIVMVKAIKNSWKSWFIGFISANTRNFTKKFQTEIVDSIQVHIFYPINLKYADDSYWDIRR